MIQNFKKNYNAKSNTYFFDEDTQFNEDFITDANIVVFGDMTCGKDIEAQNILVYGDITSHITKADRIFCTNLFSDETNCTSIVASEEINGDILNAVSVRCDNLNVVEEIKAKKISSNTMQIYKGQKIDCEELHTVKYYN